MKAIHPSYFICPNIIKPNKYGTQYMQKANSPSKWSDYWFIIQKIVANYAYRIWTIYLLEVSIWSSYPVRIAFIYQLKRSHSYFTFVVSNNYKRSSSFPSHFAHNSLSGFFNPAAAALDITGRDRLRLTALTTNHHGGGAKRRICTFVVYGETRQRQHKWSRTDIVVHTVQLMWGIIWNLTTELLCIKAVKISAGSS